MAEQSYSSPTERVPFFLGSGLILLLSLIGAGVIFVHSMNRPAQHHVSMLIAAVAFASMAGISQSRLSTLKVQDRAIRAEENLRHFALTGKLIDHRLTVAQIIAVRFASDDQFPKLAAEAANNGMKPDDIKKAVTNWRPDFHRA